MKNRLLPLFHRYLGILLSFLPVVIILRLQEYLYLEFVHVVPAGTWKYELAGLGVDFSYFLFYAVAVFIPYYGVSLLHRRTGFLLAFLLFMAHSLLGYALTAYFTITLIPLDQVIFSYSLSEIVMIVTGSVRFDPWSVLLFIIVLGGPVLLWFYIRHKKYPKTLQWVAAVLLALSPIVSRTATPERNDFVNDFGYYVISNKPYYAVSRIIFSRLEERKGERSTDIRHLSNAFHKENPEFKYLDPDYPFLRVDDSGDVLGEYFSFSADRPNLVFIIVESLSTSFSGPHAFYGSFMPFLDSLSLHSLYFGNFLSTSERTFNVLSALYGSLPYSNKAFYGGMTTPFHFSLIKYLQEQGYHPYFFYGGKPSFSGYDYFMTNENVEYILRTYPDVNPEEIIHQKDYDWGYPDGIMLKRALEVVDSLNESPRLEMYLTISMHEPFTAPNQNAYLKKLSDRIQELRLSEEHKNMVLKQKRIFSTILYSDQALRDFFKAYSKRADYKNTIFFITGDHSMPELNTLFISQAERYHVPFIIFSPMLKTPATFPAVSTHLDVTPTVLAMMKHHFGIKTRPYCHWLGDGIDVSPVFRNRHSLSFVFNNRMEVEYLKGSYFKSMDRLYRVLPNLWMLPVMDTARKNALEREQSHYILLENYVADHNALVPADLYFGGFYQAVDFVPARKMEYHITRSSDLYLSLVPGQKIGQDFVRMSFSLSISVISEDPDTARMPEVVFQVLDSQMVTKAWFSYRLSPPAGAGNSHRYYLDENIDLANVNNIASDILKVYLWNRHHIPIVVDSMQISLKGYKIPDQ
jgi:phosphoglycerol transferase MdoB-like AlkP superfamily enzyme